MNSITVMIYKKKLKKKRKKKKEELHCMIENLMINDRIHRKHLILTLFMYFANIIPNNCPACTGLQLGTRSDRRRREQTFYLEGGLNIFDFEH